VTRPQSARELAYAIQFPVDGVQVQLAHETLESVEADIAKVVDELEVDTPLQKVLDGLHTGLALHGAETIDGLRERVLYSEKLQRALIESFWRFYPLWTSPTSSSAGTPSCGATR
jgi:hypothetical protein